MYAEYIIKRFFYSFLAFFISISITFSILHLMPGDYIHYLAPYLAEVNPEASELFRHQFGLDKPIIEQYFIYIYNVFHGNWGYSFQYRVPVLKIISEKLYWTLIILLPSTFLSIVIGIFMGAHFGWRSGTKKDLSVLNVMIFIRAIPSYWWAIMLILVFGFYFNLFPLGGFISISALELGINYLDVLHHAILPIFTLTLCSIPGIYYLMRNSMLLTVGEDYIITARAKGLEERNVLRKHALKNAMLPMITMITLECAHMITGSIFIETIFSWPGLGLLTFNAILARDLFLLQGIFLICTLIIIIANFIADLSYLYIDPRIKVGESA